MVNDIDWVKIEAEYITDEHSTCDSLGAKYGINTKTVSNRSNVGKWMDKRKEYQGDLKKKIIDKIEKTALEKATEWNSSDSEMFCELRELIKVQVTALKNNKDGNGNLIPPDEKALRTIVQSMVETQKGGRLCHNLTTENIGTKNPLDVLLDEDQKAAAINAARKILNGPK